MITYNHEKYIRQAIDGVLMQKANFPIELIISDDCSTDGTRTIINQYAMKYSEVIKPIYRTKNIGPTANFVDTLYHCTGKYIAICEGDDYWIDKFKLQKQVDFMDKNFKFSLCFHNALIKHEGISGKDSLFCEERIKEISEIEDVIEKWYIPSASMLLRNESISLLPKWINDIYNCDYALHLLLALNGKIKFINEVMAVYRKNSGALSGGIGKNHLYVNYQIIKLLKYFNEFTTYIYFDKINQRIVNIEKENKYLIIRMKYPIYKYLHKKIWISKIKSIYSKILL